MKPEEIEQIINYNGPDKIVHFTDYLLSRLGSSSTQKVFKSKFSSFDQKMGGLQTGEVIVISGYRKEGKTLFAESWIKSMGEADPSSKAMILSYEVQAESLLVKYTKNEASPLYVPMSLKTMDFEWLKKRCMEAKYKYNCRIILIDHLHFMVDMGGQQMSVNIGAFMRRLKQEIAIGLNLGIVLIAHQQQPKDGREASIDTLRDSSAIAQESDSTVIVSRRENLDAVEISDYQKLFGIEIAAGLSPIEGSDVEDKFSANLAIVKIECHRRTGVYRWKKMFQKRGEFMEEI